MQQSKTNKQKIKPRKQVEPKIKHGGKNWFRFTETAVCKILWKGWWVLHPESRNTLTCELDTHPAAPGSPPRLPWSPAVWLGAVPGTTAASGTQGSHGGPARSVCAGTRTMKNPSTRPGQAGPSFPQPCGSDQVAGRASPALGPQEGTGPVTDRDIHEGTVAEKTPSLNCHLPIFHACLVSCPPQTNSPGSGAQPA